MPGASEPATGYGDDLTAVGEMIAAAADWYHAGEPAGVLLSRLGRILGYTSGRIWLGAGGELQPGGAWLSDAPLTPRGAEMVARAYSSDCLQTSDAALVVPIIQARTVTGVLTLFAERRVLPTANEKRAVALIVLAVGDHLGELPVDGLSPRELEVVRLASYGLTNDQIAVRLGVGLTTVKTHLVHVFAKLAAPDRAAAVARALRDGLIA